MGTTESGNQGRMALGRWVSRPTLTVAAMVLLAVGRRALSDWGPMAALLDPTPDAQLIGDVIQTALWFAYRGLRQVWDFPELGVGRGSAPEA